MERFLRTELLLGRAALLKFKKTRITLIGLGAVGSYCLEALTRSGVGKLRIADFDIIRQSNINRNLLALEQNLGRSKTTVAAERVIAINPSCEIETLQVLVDKNNIAQISKNSDIVIDAVDSLGPKTEILAYLKLNKIPFISSMGAALRRDTLAVKTGDISQARGCALAQRLRKRLKKHRITNGILCVYSEEKTIKPAKTNKVQEIEVFRRGRARQTLGSMSTVPAIFGITLADLALRMILSPRQEFSGATQQLTE